MFKITTIT